MPTHDHSPRRLSVERLLRAQERAGLRRLVARFKKRDRKPKRPADDGGEGVPVEPNRPNNLTGGATAALEFDD
ncbi:hypothetical protein M0208_04690 [Sphingomonas sp. SUN019]|uniref:hypothetical protein n=1 Tax=Sphingomonas sp. SUN019 TaxID=2937788 RepID=UPI002164055B|nr:hypothetical protein [Sphingomonas sp. SUN019]UVO49850.1 hypothetical protein M0208_04690 [Sphingomonas sp. SUN019]